ncbi:MAG: hypothetical protein HYZ75_06675 [Elusimicrobia bacterium]|nr:hypothetical protein [Elusimicrobiota bacterium]
MKSLLLLCALLQAGTADAAVPGTLRFQGRLLNSSTSDPRAEASVSAVFRVYDAGSGGNLLWSEGPVTVSLAEGAFDALLGQSVPLSSAVFSAAGRWLEVSVDGQTLSPRQPLAAVPWALRAAAADYLEPGDPNYLQITAAPQANARFFVSSASVAGTLTVYGEFRAQTDARATGILRAGAGVVALTGAAGLLDAAQADPATTVPNAALDSSSVTKLGNAVAGPDGLALLSGSAHIPDAALDAAVVTKEGNSVNGADALALLSAGGLLESYTLDGSSVAKFTAAGMVPSSLVDGSSATKLGNGFNSANKALLLDGGGLVPNALVDASSAAKYAANGHFQNYQLDAGSVTKAANAFNAAGHLAQLDASAALTAAGAGSAVYSIVTSSGINVTGTGAKVREAGADLVPKDMLILWLGDACPGGWTEETTLRGRMPLGSCAGCTDGTTAATALITDGQLVTHAHGGAADVGMRTGGVNALTDVADTTMPYIQVLFCRKL